MGGYIFADGRTRIMSALWMVSSVFHRSASEIFAHQSLSSHISPFLHAPTSSSVLVMSKGGMREDGGRGTLVSRGDNGSLLVRSDAQHSCEFLSLRLTHTSPFASSHLFKKNLPQYLYPNPRCALSRRLQVTKDSLSTWRGGEGWGRQLPYFLWQTMTFSLTRMFCSSVSNLPTATSPLSSARR